MSGKPRQFRPTPPAKRLEAKRVDDPTLLNFMQAAKQQVEEVKRQIAEFEGFLKRSKDLYEASLKKGNRDWDLVIGKLRLSIEDWDIIRVSASRQSSSTDLPPASPSTSQSPGEQRLKLRESLPARASVERCRCPAPRQVSLPCHHMVACARCFQEAVLSEVDAHGFDITSVKCPRCLAKLPKAKLFEVFGDERTLYSRIESKMTNGQSVGRPTFDCEICMYSQQVEGSITLDCFHRVCASCLTAYLKSRINEFKVSDKDLKCPMSNCSAEIGEHIVSNSLPPADYSRLVELREKLTFIPSKGEVRTNCPNKSCSFTAYVSEKATKFDCKTCKQQYCLTCKEVARPTHRCNLAAIMRAEVRSKAEESKLELNGVKRCPSCREGVLKDDGCNFMRCVSAKCNRGTYFCWLCMKLLTLVDHYSHYPEGGPFGTTCSGGVKRAAIRRPVSAAPVRQKR
jgi:hypothetical protein